MSFNIRYFDSLTDGLEFKMLPPIRKTSDNFELRIIHLYLSSFALDF